MRRMEAGDRCRCDEGSRHEGLTMAEFTGRDLHLVKNALAIAVLAIERQPDPSQLAYDQADMKALLDVLIENDTELAHYARSARIAVKGEPD